MACTQNYSAEPRRASRFPFVDGRRGAYGTKRLCRIVRRPQSCFYDQERRPPPRRTCGAERLWALIGEIHDGSAEISRSPGAVAIRRQAAARASPTCDEFWRRWQAAQQLHASGRSRARATGAE